MNTTYTEVTPVRVLDSRVNNPAGAHDLQPRRPAVLRGRGSHDRCRHDPRRRGRGHRQPDRRRVHRGGLRHPRPGRPGRPRLVHDQLPQGRHSGERRLRSARRHRQPGGDLSRQRFRRGQQEDASRPRRHRLLPGRRGRQRVLPGGPGSIPRHPRQQPGGAHILNPSVPYAFQVGGRTVGSTTIPADAVAITGNLTVTGQTKGGFLSLTPDSQPNPTTSTLNFPVSDTRANNVTVKLGAGGNLYVVYKGTGKAHAILDITGYFRNDASGLSYVPVTPTRTVDTRVGPGHLQSAAGQRTEVVDDPWLRRRRERREGLHGQPDHHRPDQGWLHLGHPDPGCHSRHLDDQLPGR